MEWQPIENAPVGEDVDGTCWALLAWGPEDDKTIGKGLRWRDKWFAGASFYCGGNEKRYQIRELEVRPTHWMPLPKPPKAD